MKSESEPEAIAISILHPNDNTDIIEFCLRDALSQYSIRFKKRLAALGLRIAIIPALTEPPVSIGKGQLAELRYSERAAYHSPSKTIFISEIPYIEDYGDTTYSDTALGLGRADADLAGLLDSGLLLETVNADKENMEPDVERRLGRFDLPEIYSRIFFEMSYSPYRENGSWVQAFPRTFELAKSQINK